MRALFLFALCSAVAVTNAAAPTSSSAQDWLSQVPSLPATAEGAYSQWTDVSGVLRPNDISEKVTAGIKAQILTLARLPDPPIGYSGSLRPRDKELVEKIIPFRDATAVASKIRTAQTEQAAVLQKWHAELNSLEQRRQQARSALPACHNEAGTPSQASIRDVEQAFAREKVEIAVRYLSGFQPRLDQLLAAVSPQIEHGDTTFAAWSKLSNLFQKAQLAPIAQGAETDALQDVAAIQSYIQEVSKLAARAVAERNAMQRLYAKAQGC